MLEEFVTALVGHPFGLKGFVKIRGLSGPPDHLASAQVLNLRRPAVQGTPFADAVPYRVAESRQAGDGSLYLKFDGFDTPEAAKTLKGMEIVVPRAAAAPLAPNEFYIEDLKGLIVIDSKGAQIGVIENVIEGGGGELVEVVLENGVRRLVPFRKEFFGDISLGQGSAVLTALWVLE